jgi:VWFA-related protein
MAITGQRQKRVRKVQSAIPKQNQWRLSRLSLLLFAVLLLLTDLPVRSQESAPITLNINAVNLLATVRDKHGNIVRNLTKDDFVLEQEGKPQTITYFAKESDLPLTLGLLVDTSMSQRHVLDQERAASRTFLDQIFRADKDKAFIIQFDREVTLLQDLTSSRKKLQAAIDQVAAPQFSQASNGGSSGGGGGGGRGSHGRGGGGTLLYDAVFLASDELMKKQQGRKAVVILTDGVDHGSKETLEEAIATAQRADTLVYCILFADKEGYGNGGGFGGPHMGGGMGGRGGRGGGYPPRTEESHPDGKKVLKQMSEASGGRLFEVSKKEPIDKIFDAIDEELRYQYSLGYTPVKADTDVGYHKLHLTVKQKDMIVQTRDGFYLDR